MAVGIGNIQLLGENRKMTLKVQSFTWVAKVPIIRKSILKCFNKLNIRESIFQVESIHFKKNKVFLQKDNYFECKADGFMQNSMVYMENYNNSIIINDRAELYSVNIRVLGENNQIIIGKECVLRNSDILIKGNHNKIIIGNNVSAYNATFHLGQDKNEVRIGNGTTLHGRDYHSVHFELYESSKIVVGTDCMFSNGIQIRPSDAHSIVDLKGNRLNPARDIIIGDHCWIGFGVIILKGTHIQNNTVVGAGSLCTKKYSESYCVLAGNPARVVKQQIDWNRKFL